MFNLGEISMKKSLVALAALAAATGAFAQSSVTMFGVVDATFAYGKSDVNKRTSLTNSGLNSSRFGVRGVEDLGGGMNGSFHLEAGLNNDNGSMGATTTDNQGTASGGGGLTFNRRSTVSLGGGFGEVRLGRDYTPHFWNQTVYDPFGTNGVGTTQTLNGVVTNAAGANPGNLGGPTTVRASNSIGYFLPGNLGGAFGQVQYYMGENQSNVANKNDGNGFSARGGYANGPISAALAFGQTKYLAGTGKITTVNFGGSYDLGVVKLSGLYDQDKNALTGLKGAGFLFGVNAPVGAGEIRAAFSTYKVKPVVGGNPSTNKFAVGYVYNLSKRTAAYGTFALVSNKNGATSALNGASGVANKKSSGFDVGVRHSF
jgi:predicted porin